MITPKVKIGQDVRTIAGTINSIGDAVNRLYSMKGDSRLRVNWPGGVPCLSTRVRGGGSPGNSYEYPGPFKVVQKDDTTVTVEGYNVTEDRNWRNYIDVGLDTPLELDEQDLAIAATGWVYLVLTQTANVYDTPTIATDATLPPQDNTHTYIRLAYVVVEDAVIYEIVQWQYGGMVLPGRAF